MVEFKVSENAFFYILRTNKSKDFYVFNELDPTVERVKKLIKGEGLTIEDIEIMSIKVEKEKINAQQVSWAMIAEKLIKGEP